MSDFRTIAEAVANFGEVWPERTFTFQDMKGEETSYTFADIGEATEQRAAAYQRLGLGKGDRFGLVVIEPEEFILAFLAATRIGALPIPMYPPLSFGSLDAYADKSAKILDNAGAKLLVASKRLENILWGLVDKVPSLDKLVAVEELRKGSGTPDYPEIAPDDLCFLQYTSGSTSDPKGVMVTHANLIANTNAIIDHTDIRPDDKHECGVSWLPLYHDMGLIGHVIAPVVRGIPSVFIPTMRFIKRPHCWLDTIHEHRGTCSFAPNFAYALAAKRARQRHLDKWDLSSMHVFGCGAEPIHPDTMQQFVDTFSEHCNLARDVILPAYGMAEATLAMTLKPEGTTMKVCTVDHDHFQLEGVAAEPQGDAEAVQHVSCGTPLPGHDVAIFDPETGERVPEGVEGEICFKGPSVTPGYYQNPEATAAARYGEWLRTGDLGYVLDGETYVTGRLKDLIILNGRNIHPQAVEWEVAEVDGVRKGNVVAFSRPGDTSEELVVVFETKLTDDEAIDEVVDAIEHRVQREMSLRVADVVPLSPGTLPKTSSGKLQRRKTRSQYLTDQLGGTGVRTMGAQGDKVTLAKHVARSLWSRAKATVLFR